ncbi:MAG: hypothetical protein [Arizlama microvirus]|nr:MAG: hypothetical protein [Arizlama microvirus]
MDEKTDLKANEDFDLVTVEWIEIKQNDKVLLRTQLSKDISETQLRVLAASLKNGLKQIGLEKIDVYFVYSKKWC